MKAIETVYKGYKFRSRLEARWAVFFDALNIKWEYEKEGFDLDGLWYLPDFWLPEQKYWIEIKGEEPTAEEIEKCRRLAKTLRDEKLRDRVFLFIGSIPFPPADEAGLMYCGPNGISKCAEYWVTCPVCEKACLKVDGRVNTEQCECLSHFTDALYNLSFSFSEKYEEWWEDKIRLFLSAGNAPWIMEAYTAARQARF